MFFILRPKIKVSLGPSLMTTLPMRPLPSHSLACVRACVCERVVSELTYVTHGRLLKVLSGGGKIK